MNISDEPRFAVEGSNVTVVVGRDAALLCTVENLHNYKVAWLRVDTQTILTIGPHVITKNHRVGVSRSDSQTWSLTLRDVRPSDGGRYMCQINTEPMITQTHILQVFVPPDIVDSSSSSEVMIREGDNVTLHCAASGTPQPTILWRREDSALLTVNGKSVLKWKGEWLNMTSVERQMNGAFLCIATNGVPPTVSKRIVLHVLCKPTANMTQKMIGGYLGESVQLQCMIEANPPPVVHWTHINANRLPNGSKYQASMTSQGYKHTAVLKVNNVSRDDIGSYHCYAENSLGVESDDITLYTLATTTVTTTSTTYETTKMDTTSSQPYAELNPNDEMYEKDSFEEDNYVVVLSQHQMQSLDHPPSS
ncbi:lachesin-like [Hyposmocoma kahamanoa]|uniref:lachesin-like n=1 Tax=Hyposmocoma kahamanoa TaxID=1477025 RepID=UPI000E6D75A6|nr:lachesin-like [Hyposmocoma kahamanoa]